MAKRTATGDSPNAATGNAHGTDAPPLPATRAELLALHDAARRRRDAAPLDSRERVEAAFELERIEVQIARVERAMDPPLV
ncbi:MAG TPA: hypothetical protein VNL94_02125 [Candidatus Binatia bacterium]|nr:hypothetical protein [Candidatus Binatia bacterium]